LRLLLDTHAFLRWCADDPRLRAAERNAIREGAGEVCLFEHEEAAARLPPLHRDPFDRMILAQARFEGLTLVTSGPLVRSYPGVAFLPG
jgi:PIN domain nuclease of toxin-antitoxin system